MEDLWNQLVVFVKWCCKTCCHGSPRGHCQAARPSAPPLSGGGTATRGCGGHAAPIAFQSYSDPDNANCLPRFRPSRPVGAHFGCPFLRNTKAVEFFHFFFTEDIVSDICRHTNSYGKVHIIAESHQLYIQSAGSWRDKTPEEINRLIALIYFGFVRVSVNTDRYWSTKILY